MTTFLNNGFEGSLALAAGVNSVKALMKAAGYAGRFAAKQFLVKNRTGADIFHGRRDDVSAANGAQIEDGVSRNLAPPRGSYDVNVLYVYSAAGGTIDVVMTCR